MKSIAYVGIDVHKDSVSVLMLPEEGNDPILERRLENDSLKVKKFFVKWSESYEMHCCYEASGCGYVLHRWLKDIGVACDVVAPSLIPRRPGDKVKTDRRDALKLARLYRAGELTAVHIPSEEDESVRSLVRCRETMLREVNRSKHYILKFLCARGFIYRDGSHWTQKHWRWLRGLRFEGPDGIVWSEYIYLLEYKLSRLEELDRQIEEIAFSDAYKEAVGLLRCFRGIDVGSAMVIVSEVQDFRRFAGPGKLMSFLGLAPGQDSSGPSSRNCGITKSGNSRCRRVLLEAAWHYRHKAALSAALKKRQAGQPTEAIAHSWKAQHRLHKKFWKLASRMDRRKAAVAVARELVGFIWAVMVSSPEVSLPLAA